MRRPRTSRFLLVPLLASLCLAPAGCATNPATGKRQFSLISEAQEIEMGREYDKQIVAQLGLYPDTALQRYVQELGSRMAALSERPNLPWTFRVLDDPVVNAFALPGGFIYVTRGILAHLDSEAELVAVLGHEIGHVTARHSVSRMSTQQLAQLGLAIGTVIRPELAGYADLASAGLGMLFLKYGRDDEREADDLGFRYLRRVGYDPREMPGVFEMLAAVSEASGGGRVPEWLSTHPDPENRRQRIEQLLAGMTEDLSGARVERESYIRRLNGLVFGDNPREGFFRNNLFLHPELRFQFTFPSGWTTANQKDAVYAVSPNQDAIVQITLESQATPSAAANAFFGQQGLTVLQRPASASINGLEAVSGAFAANTQQGAIGGTVAFISHGGAVYRVLAYSAEARYASYRSVFEQTIRSFNRLTDPAALAVQPMRLEIVRLDRAMTIDEFMRRYPGPASAATIALLNNVPAGGTLPSGSLVKRVVGQAAS